MDNYTCVNCSKPNLAEQLRCTNCGTLHNSKFEEQKFHLQLKHMQEDAIIAEVDLTEKELILVLGINLQNDQLEKFIADGVYKIGFLEYAWNEILP